MRFGLHNVCGMVVLLIFTYVQLGGIVSAHQQLTDMFMMKMCVSRRKTYRADFRVDIHAGGGSPNGGTL